MAGALAVHCTGCLLVTRSIFIGTFVGAILALHQYLLVACSSTPIVITLLDVVGLPLAFGLPVAGGFLASRAREQAYTRHSAIVGAIAGTGSMLAVGIRWATKPGVEFAAYQQVMQGVMYLLVFAYQWVFAIVGGYFATQTKRKPRP